MSEKKKIFGFVEGQGTYFLNVVGLSEDGIALASHASSTIEWAKHDIGVTSDWQHETYRKAYPDGYEVIWVDDPQAHPECKAAIDKANARVKTTEVPA